MIRKALIPVAGRATRLMPVSCVVPKAMFPLADKHNGICSVLHVVVTEAKSAGIEHIGIIVNPTHLDMLERYFMTVSEDCSNDLPSQIEYIIQQSPKGFGDAVLQGAEFIGDEPFVLLLGDHVYIEEAGDMSCVAQVVKAFDSFESVAMIGVQPVSMEELSKVGVACGTRIQRNVYRCTNFAEKPDIETAQQELVTKDLPENTFLGHCGIYAFEPEIFDCLGSVSAMSQKTGKDVELADAQLLLFEKYPGEYLLYEISGRAYDTGTPVGYAKAQVAFAELVR